MRKIVFASLGLTLLSGCVTHTFAPGPGLSANDFEPDSANCRLFARGAQSGFAFGAAGSPKFVGAAMGGAAIGYAIGSAIERNRNYNDCMIGHGWQVADGTDASSDVAMSGKLASSPPAPTAPIVMASTAAAVTPVTATEAARREFLVRAADVTASMAANLHLDRPRGVMILTVDAAGVAKGAGIREGDVILTFDGTPISGMSGMRNALATIEPNQKVAATIWRTGAERSVAIQF